MSLNKLFIEIIEYAEDINIINKSDNYQSFKFENISNNQDSMSNLINLIDNFSEQYILATGKKGWEPFWNLVYFFKSKMPWDLVKGGTLTISTDIVNIKDKYNKNMLQAMYDPNFDVLLVINKMLDDSSFGQAIDESKEMVAYRIF